MKKWISRYKCWNFIIATRYYRNIIVCQMYRASPEDKSQFYNCRYWPECDLFNLSIFHSFFKKPPCNSLPATLIIKVSAGLQACELELCRCPLITPTSTNNVAKVTEITKLGIATYLVKEMSWINVILACGYWVLPANEFFGCCDSVRFRMKRLTWKSAENNNKVSR